ncbi:hypothetical protein BRYFOR_05845 [Marvinbryantia formatexigens DSM 14469]|uniref:Uncharacterized protein n=1 Tax=Marvinbryantia formatexigens DSM 14469 TaxID=478749 RepID=C6LB50_9FIRM|nr:hypothetical protein BRYFOR_05845 [Marvinbryantia formatexigens DSM 14469]
MPIFLDFRQTPKCFAGDDDFQKTDNVFQKTTFRKKEEVIRKKYGMIKRRRKDKHATSEARTAEEQKTAGIRDSSKT